MRRFVPFVAFALVAYSLLNAIANAASTPRSEQNAFEKLRFLLGTWDCKEYLNPTDPPDPRDLLMAYTADYSLLPGAEIETIEGRQVITHYYRLGDPKHTPESGVIGWGGSQFFIFQNPRLFFVQVDTGIDPSSGVAKWANGTLMIQRNNSMPSLNLKRLANNTVEWIVPSEVTVSHGMKGSNIGGVTRCTRHA